ncbi:MAG: NYN domain-containing protein [Acidimicrobiia bacterium]|nr:NYN domain-containing protein [Acidimicrobiia bacterium]
MDEDRIALFLDYENLAIGAREDLGGISFDFRPISDALADRGRVVSRRAYADWSMFDDDRRMLTRHQVELIEIPQRMGVTRKNAADIKMAVDAVELALERDWVTSFVICTGDSDFTPLVYKLRELNKKVIGVGVKASTSKMLPPACDEFLFYENLEGVEPNRPESRPDESSADEEAASEPDRGEDWMSLVTRTLGGMQSVSGETVPASTLKRAVLRKDSTFSEADHGFRGFGELLRHLEGRGVVTLGEGPARGDPLVSFPENGGDESAFQLLSGVVAAAEGKSNGTPVLSGMKDLVRKQQSSFSEKKLGYGGFLQFVKAAQNQGWVSIEWDDDAGDYRITSLRG